MINEICLVPAVNFELLNISTTFFREKEVLLLFATSTETTKKSNCPTPLTHTSAVTLPHSERLAVLQLSVQFLYTNIETGSHMILLSNGERL
jgi:hypothetical protein